MTEPSLIVAVSSNRVIGRDPDLLSFGEGVCANTIPDIRLFVPRSAQARPCVHTQRSWDADLCCCHESSFPPRASRMFRTSSMFNTYP
jgi:hypothetical protein